MPGSDLDPAPLQADVMAQEGLDLPDEMGPEIVGRADVG